MKTSDYTICLTHFMDYRYENYISLLTALEMY